MCLAIGHKDYARRGVIARQWWKIAAHPLRLFTFLALFHLVVIFIMQKMDAVTFSQIAESYTLPLLIIALLGGLLLGLLFEKLPLLLATSPIEYNIFGSSYNLSFFGLLALELSWLFGPVWSLLATALLILTWAMAVRTLFWRQHWTQYKPAWLLSTLMWSLYGILAMLALLLVAQLSAQVHISGLLSGFALIIIFAVLVQYLLLHKLRA